MKPPKMMMYQSTTILPGTQYLESSELVLVHLDYHSSSLHLLRDSGIGQVFSKRVTQLSAKGHTFLKIRNR